MCCMSSIWLECRAANQPRDHHHHDRIRWIRPFCAVTLIAACSRKSERMHQSSFGPCQFPRLSRVKQNHNVHCGPKRTRETKNDSAAAAAVVSDPARLKWIHRWIFMIQKVCSRQRWCEKKWIEHWESVRFPVVVQLLQGQIRRRVVVVVESNKRNWKLEILTLFQTFLQVSFPGWRASRRKTKRDWGFIA